MFGNKKTPDILTTKMAGVCLGNGSDGGLALVAMGDETRQHILMIMLNGECSGSRVIDITERTNLSRPAVSHHMQILKDAGFVKVRKEGTKHYYYLDMDDNEIDNLCRLFEDIRKILKNVPDRSEKDN